MPVHHSYDETAGHPVVVAAMSPHRPFWRSALLGCYVELVSVAGKQAKAAADADLHESHVDGAVTAGDVMNIEPWFTDCLIAGLVRFGYMHYLGADRFQLDYHGKLLHSRTAKQLWWERMQRKDTFDKVMRAAVRYRDGDQCRCCHLLITNWEWSSSDPDGGTLDHVRPGVPAEGSDDLAILCRRCNGIRSDRPDANMVAPLQSPPRRPFFSKSTITYLKGAGYVTDIDGESPLSFTGQKYLLDRIEILPRPASQAATADESDPTPSGTPLPSKWAWEGPQGHSSHVCGSRPATMADTARRAPEAAHTAPQDVPSDPEPIGIPQQEKRRENVGKTHGKRQTVLPPEPPPPSTNPAILTGGLSGGEGKGLVGSGLGTGPRQRQRGRRGGRAKGDSHER